MYGAQSSADWGDGSIPGTMFWLDYQLSLERELIREAHRVQIRSMGLDELREATDRVLVDYHLTKHLLRQHVRRVAELELRIALDEPDDRHRAWARELLDSRGAE